MIIINQAPSDVMSCAFCTKSDNGLIFSVKSNNPARITVIYAHMECLTELVDLVVDLWYSHHE